MKRNRVALFFIFMMFIAISLIPMYSDAKSGSLVVSAGTGKSIEMGTLQKGQVVDYSWQTDDPTDKVNFKITDGSNSYERASSTYRSSGSFNVPSYGSYRLYWYNDNYWMDADLSYSYDVEYQDETPVENDETITIDPPVAVSDVDDETWLDMIKDKAVIIIIVLTFILVILLAYSIVAILQWKRENDEIDERIDKQEAVLESDIIPSEEEYEEDDEPEEEYYSDYMGVNDDDVEDEENEKYVEDNNRNIKRKLRDLKEMYEEDLLSAAEYRKMRNEILRRF